MDLYIPQLIISWKQVPCAAYSSESEQFNNELCKQKIAVIIMSRFNNKLFVTAEDSRGGKEKACRLRAYTARFSITSD